MCFKLNTVVRLLMRHFLPAVCSYFPACKRLRFSTICHQFCLTPKTVHTMDVACFKDGSESHRDEKLIYPAATRNQVPILQVLKKFVNGEADDTAGRSILFLEIASGSGQHVAYFGPQFPKVTFQPTEVDDSLLGSINYYARNCLTKNIKPPILVDICNNLSSYGFEPNSVDYMYNANMIHISPYECTIGLFKNAGEYLRPHGLLITYGPYSQDGVITPESNVQFNESLKSRDPRWGLRDTRDLIKLGKVNNLLLKDQLDMPANNKTLIWEKVV